MAVTLYTYNKLCDSDRLTQEILAAAITVAIDHIETFSSPEKTDVYMKAELSSGEEDTLDALIDAHVNTPLPDNEIKTVALDAASDSEDALIIRSKTTRVGWRYCPRWITWTTSLYGSLNNKKVDTTTDFGDAVLRFWKLSGTTWVEILRADYASDELYQTALDSECIITTMDWETTYDYDIKGAAFLMGNSPSQPTWAYLLAAPDIPAIYGGSISFVEGGVPLHLFEDKAFIPFDGVTTKAITADPVYHSNKFRIVVNHPAGQQQTLAVGWQHFKA